MRPLEQLECHKRTYGKGSKTRGGEPQSYDIRLGHNPHTNVRTVVVQHQVINGRNRLRVMVKQLRQKRKPEIHEIEKIRQLFFFPWDYVFAFFGEPNQCNHIDLWENPDHEFKLPTK
jgi:hypothetical protein